MQSQPLDHLPSRRIDLLCGYFASGWLFFLPYLVVYLVFWLTKAPVDLALGIYWALHVAHGVGLIAVALRRRSRFTDPRAWFFVSVTLIFLMQGVFLEFPGDNWIHMRRILSWNHAEDFAPLISYEMYKSGYFLIYSLVGWLPNSMLVLALSLCGAVIAALLAYQVWRFLRACGLGDVTAQIGVVASLVFMGTTLPFYSYFAISTSVLSMIGTLGALRALLDAKRLKYLLWLAGLAFAGFNHMQGVGHVMLGSLAIACWAAQKRWGTPRTLAVLGVLGVLGVLAGLVFVKWIPQGKAMWGAIEGTRESGWLTWFGSFRIWDVASLEGEGATTRFLEVVTWLGLANFIAAIILISKRRVLGWITLMPLIAIVYPVSASMIAYAHTGSDSIITYHRYLLLILPLAASIELIGMLISRKREARWGIVGVASGLVIILLLGIPDQRHWLGKVRTLGNPQSNVGRLAFLEPMVVQIEGDERFENRKVVVISDPAVSTYLVSHFGFHAPEFRLNINASSNPVFADNDALGALIGDYDHMASWTVCVVVPVKEPEIPLYYSPVGVLTRHWRGFALNEAFQFDPSAAEWCEENLNEGWESFDLGPWHRCYLKLGGERK